MCLSNLPVEVQEIIFSEIKYIKILYNLLLSSNSIHSTVSKYIFQWKLKHGLDKIMRQKKFYLLNSWKRTVFDVYPHGEFNRKIIVNAFFFLSGFYRVSSSIKETFSRIDPSINSRDYENMKYLGSSLHQNFQDSRRTLCYSYMNHHRSYLIQYINSMSDILQNPLFEEIIGFKNFYNRILGCLNV